MSQAAEKFGYLEYQARIDSLLDKLIEIVAERDLAVEKLAYAENEWLSCLERHEGEKLL